MLNSYQRGCLINESHVFYTSINTFRNPAFEPQLEHDTEGGVQDKAAMAVSQRAQPNKGALPTSCSNDMSFSSNQSELSQRWQEFCDNLSLSIKGRLFIMESNLKRRLRAIRKYLNKKAPWILAQVSQHESHGLRPQVAGGEPPLVPDEGVGRGFGRFHFPEPSSAKTLDAQQERLLNRLKRIKRQRLFNLPGENVQQPGQPGGGGGGGSGSSGNEDADCHREEVEGRTTIERVDCPARGSRASWGSAKEGSAPGAIVVGPMFLETGPGAPQLGLLSSIVGRSAPSTKPKVSRRLRDGVSRSACLCA